MVFGFCAFCIGIPIARRLQAPKSWFLAPSGARNQDFEISRLENSWISLKNVENAQKIVKKFTFGAFYIGIPIGNTLVRGAVGDVTTTA